MKEPKDTLSLKREGITVSVITHRVQECTLKEYIDMLDGIDRQIASMKNQKNKIGEQIERALNEREKFVEHVEFAKSVLISGVKNKIKEIEKTKEYEETPEKNRRAFLFSRPELMDYAPESILREVIWVEPTNLSSSNKAE